MNIIEFVMCNARTLLIPALSKKDADGVRDVTYTCTGIADLWDILLDPQT
jgi:hypothetical protein